MRKRLRKKLLRRRPSALGLVAPGVFMREIDVSEYTPAIHVGPTHLGKKGSAVARYRLRRWHRRNPFALWAPPPDPAIVTNPPVLITSQSQLETVFGRLPRRPEPLLLIGDGGSVLPVLPEDNVIGPLLEGVHEEFYKSCVKDDREA